MERCLDDLSLHLLHHVTYLICNILQIRYSTLYVTSYIYVGLNVDTGVNEDMGICLWRYSTPSRAPAAVSFPSPPFHGIPSPSSPTTLEEITCTQQKEKHHRLNIHPVAPAAPEVHHGAVALKNRADARRLAGPKSENGQPRGAVSPTVPPHHEPAARTRGSRREDKGEGE